MNTVKEKKVNVYSADLKKKELLNLREREKLNFYRCAALILC